MSKQPRKERRTLYTLPAHLMRRQIAAHLAEDLMVQYGRRTVTVRKGDTVKVLRGDYKGVTGKIASVDPNAQSIVVDGVTQETAKHAQKPRGLHPSNVIVTKLDLTDPRRRAKLGATEGQASGAGSTKAAKAAKKEES